MPTEDTDNILETTLLDRLFTIINEVPEQQEKARKNIVKSQQNQKQRHDQKVDPTKKFKIRDKVLLYDAARDKHFTGKLKPKWKGPFYIHDVLSHGAYKLQTMEGKTLAAPLNTLLLK